MALKDLAKSIEASKPSLASIKTRHEPSEISQSKEAEQPKRLAKESSRTNDFMISIHMKGTALNLKTITKRVDELKDKIERSGFVVNETHIKGGE